MAERLADGWGDDSPCDDTLLRAYVESYADLLEAMGEAGGRPTARTADYVAFDSRAPFPFLNAAVLRRPVLTRDDPVLDEIAAFFTPGDEPAPFLVLSTTPMSSLAERGWELMGHPPLMLRPAGPAGPPRPDRLEIVEVRDPEALHAFDRTMIEAFPVPELIGRRAFTDATLDMPGWTMWLGMVDGEPVATAAAHVAHGMVDVEWISTLPAHRGRGIGEAVTWAATRAAPELPAMLIASDMGQPVYARMGYLRVARLTLWVGTRARAG
jgi:GNAT superfamily N-acetyltransferase